MVDRVTSDEIARAREVHLLDYLESKGESIINQGRYYRHQEHDSLVFKDNMYFWNSKQEKGAGAISFAMSYYDLSFPQAVKDVNGLGIAQTKELRQEQEKNKPKLPFEYPHYLETKDNDAIKNYLVNERKIDARIIDWLIRKDLLVQDKKENAVFKWRDYGGTGGIVGADRQGTRKMENKKGTFKQIMPNSKEHSGFTIDIGQPNKIYAFESPIDMLSYWSLQKRNLKDARLVSMNGVKPKTIALAHLEAHKAGYHINHWVLAVDNDKGGLNFIEKMKTLVDEKIIKIDIPPQNGDDWNKHLIRESSVPNSKDLIKIKQAEKALER